MSAGLGVEIEPFIAATVSRGGHLRVGLEDAPMGCTLNNRELVECAARMIAPEAISRAPQKCVRRWSRHHMNEWRTTAVDELQRDGTSSKR